MTEFGDIVRTAQDSLQGLQFSNRRQEAVGGWNAGRAAAQAHGYGGGSGNGVGDGGNDEEEQASAEDNDPYDPHPGVTNLRRAMDPNQEAPKEYSTSPGLDALRTSMTDQQSEPAPHPLASIMSGVTGAAPAQPQEQEQPRLMGLAAAAHNAGQVSYAPTLTYGNDTSQVNPRTPVSGGLGGMADSQRAQYWAAGAGRATVNGVGAADQQRLQHMWQPE